MKLPIINNREIVPVRLIPIITANNIGRQTIAGILAHRLKANGFPLDPDYDQVEVEIDDEATVVSRAHLFGTHSRDLELYAYHLNDEYTPVRMLSTEWDEIYRDISMLEPMLRKEEEIIGIPDSKESIWMIEAMKILPPGVFIWREDMDELWHANINYKMTLPEEREDTRKLNYDAYVATKYSSLVMEGFEQILKSTKTSTSTYQDTKPNAKINESLLKMVIAMAMDFYGHVPNVKNNKSTSDIKKAAEKVGLSISENTIRTHLKAAAELLPRDFNQNSQ